MAALYPFSFLHHIDPDDIEKPMSRYVFKFENHRNEITRLKHHEKDFLFRCLKLLNKETGKPAYNLFTIPEAKEFLFHWIILCHANQLMVFEGKISGPNGLLSKDEINRNKQFFFKYLDEWKERIEEGTGPYFSVIKPAIMNKLKALNEWASENKNRRPYLIKKQVYVYAVFFHIYYHVKLYFDEKPKPFILKRIGGTDVVFNVYSFVHILSRHYYPDMNKCNDVSLNTELTNINLDYLPNEIIKLIEIRNKKCPITPKTEYLLFQYGTDYYILWLKYKKLNETGNFGFEVRSFYKCETQCDLDKVNEPNQCIIKVP